MADELTAEATALIGFSLLIAVVTLISVRNYTNHASDTRRKLMKQTSDLEKELFSMRRDLNELKLDSEKKIDSDYLNRRIDGLINLIKGR